MDLVRTGANKKDNNHFGVETIDRERKQTKLGLLSKTFPFTETSALFLHSNQNLSGMDDTKKNIAETKY